MSYKLKQNIKIYVDRCFESRYNILTSLYSKTVVDELIQSNELVINNRGYITNPGRTKLEVGDTVQVIDFPDRYTFMPNQVGKIISPFNNVCGKILQWNVKFNRIHHFDGLGSSDVWNFPWYHIWKLANK